MVYNFNTLFDNTILSPYLFWCLCLTHLAKLNKTKPATLSMLVSALLSTAGERISHARGLVPPWVHGLLPRCCPESLPCFSSQPSLAWQFQSIHSHLKCLFSPHEPQQTPCLIILRTVNRDHWIKNISYVCHQICQGTHMYAYFLLYSLILQWRRKHSIKLSVLWILPSPTFLKISSSIKINLDYMLLLYQKYFQ